MFSESQRMEYSTLADEKVVSLFQAGDADALDYLIQKYKNFVRAKSKPYFIVGAAKEDLYQEGMIGLFKAIRDYHNDKDCSFITFAEICIVRHVITAVKSATRKKHRPLNSYISLDKPIVDDEYADRTMLDVMDLLRDVSPEEILVSRETAKAVEERTLSLLSELEKQVLVLYVEGRSYQEISEMIHKPTKTIDNALQRIKKKALAETHGRK